MEDLALRKREKGREYEERYRKNNSEKIKQLNKQWNKNNPKKLKKAQERWRENNPDYQKQFRQKKRQFINDYKLSKGCIICGYNRCASALEFHHDKGKDFILADAVSYGKTFKKIKEEMDKCVVICANCHRELHERERLFGKQVPLKSLDKLNKAVQDHWSGEDPFPLKKRSQI